MSKMTIVQPIRIDENIERLIELKSREEHTSKSNVLRYFVYTGIEEYALALCAAGRLSLSKCAELLNKSIWELLDLAKRKNIPLTIDKEAMKQSDETASAFIKKAKNV